MQYTFETPTPTGLVVRIDAGDVVVEARGVEQTVLDLSGPGADDAEVEQRGGEIHVVGPSSGGLFRSRHEIRLHAVVPLLSDLTTSLGSADVTASGELGRVSLKNGSGRVRVETVSGAAIAETGSGNLELGTVGGTASLTSGSGTLSVGSARAELEARTGSGAIHVGGAHHDLALRSGSGTITVGAVHGGAVQAKSGSGDVRIGVPAGLPTWTDLSSGSGRVSCDLDPVGEPAPGQAYVEIRAKTGSGSISLRQLQDDHQEGN